MLKYIFSILITTFTLFSCSKAFATEGCYSLSTQRFYYVEIGTNNYSGSTYAVAGSTASCSTFTSGYYTNASCNIQGTSNSNYRQATTNVTYPCPLDGNILLLMGFSALAGFYLIRKQAIV